MKLSIRRVKTMKSPPQKFRRIERGKGIGPFKISMSSTPMGKYHPYRRGQAFIRIGPAYFMAWLNNEGSYSAYYSLPKGWTLSIIGRSCYGHYPAVTYQSHCDIRGHFTPSLDRWVGNVGDEVRVKEFNVWTLLKLLPFVKEY